MFNLKKEKGKAPIEENNCSSPVDHLVSTPNSRSSSVLFDEDRLKFSGVDQLDSIQSFVFESPNGSRYWTPIVDSVEKPSVGMLFCNLDHAFIFYNAYAEKSGFSTRLGPTKKSNGLITHRYLLCEKSGKPKCQNIDSMDLAQMDSVRVRTYKVCDCKARIKLKAVKGCSTFVIYEFVESHNHDLVSSDNADLSKRRRQLSYSDQHFIHRMSINKIGARVAHRLQSGLRGGAHNMRGTETDYINFSRDIRKFIGDRDAKMFVEKLEQRCSHLPNFSFEYSVVDGELRSMFWADDVSKVNFKEFGDVLAFDATYHTNKYDMIFVPFTGVDHHKKCVTFGAGLLSSESVQSYQWLLQCFVKAHPKPPSLVLTDQDPSMKQAVEFVFHESTHRLCMWHIMKKLPSKFSGDFLLNSNFRASIHKLVWNPFISPSTFERRWLSIVNHFKLTNHVWLRDMYAIRHRWVPAYFRDIQMCCLMKTTSRCESSNAVFKVNSSGGNTLVQFLLCFDTAIDGQRYKQRVIEHKSNTTTTSFRTPLAIERHALELYTQVIFLDVQKEIFKGMLLSFITNYEKSVDGVEVFNVHHADKRSAIINEFKVHIDMSTKTVSCSCRGFTRIGYLCRHVFCVYRYKKVEQIPEKYVIRRWIKHVLPPSVYRIDQMHAVDNTEIGVKRNDVLDLVSLCMDRLRGHLEGFESFAQQIKEIKEDVYAKYPVVAGSKSTSCVISDLVGDFNDSDVPFSAPRGIKNKGSGTKRRRVIGPGEKAVVHSKKTGRKCHRCLEYGDHDSRNCHLNDEAGPSV